MNTTLNYISGQTRQQAVKSNESWQEARLKQLDKQLAQNLVTQFYGELGADIEARIENKLNRKG